MASVKTSHTKMIDRSMAASFDVKGLLYLYHIHLTDGREVRLFPGRKTSQIIQFGGHKYRAHPIETDGFSWQIDDSVHQPYLRLARQDLALDLSPHDDVFRGGTVERLITFASECAPPIGTNGGASFPPETWQIDRLAQLDEAVISFALQPIAPMAGAFLPHRVMLRDICQHRYRRWDKARGQFDYSQATCPYRGRWSYTKDGTPTTKRQEDVCSQKLVSGCKKRFKGTLPFFGFPGLSR